MPKSDPILWPCRLLLQLLVPLQCGALLFGGSLSAARGPALVSPLHVLHEERGVEFEVPSHSFFRADSKTSRDLGVLAAVLYRQRHGNLRVVDAFGGCGTRSVRYLHHAGADEVLCNDANEELHGVLHENLGRSAREGQAWEVLNMDANKLLLNLGNSREHFDLIDADSFGLSSRTITAGLHAVKYGGLLYVTNTDGRCSAGRAPYRSLSAYGSWTIPHSAVNEQGLRLLLGAVARQASALGLEARPVFSLYSPHGPVYRSMLSIHPSKRPELALQGKYAFMAHCKDCHHAEVAPFENMGSWKCTSCLSSAVELNGPMWVGELHNRTELEEMKALARTFGWQDLDPLLDVMVEEADPALPPFYVNMHELSRFAKVNPPPRARLEAHLKRQGFLAGRTHIARDGVKTDAPMSICVECTRQAANDAAATVDAACSNDESG